MLRRGIVAAAVGALYWPLMAWWPPRYAKIEARWLKRSNLIIDAAQERWRRYRCGGAEPVNEIAGSAETRALPPR